MSIVAFKRKSVIMAGTHISGKTPGGIWIPQGPFGKHTGTSYPWHGDSGFSLNGTHRNKGPVGQTMAFSKNGTPFRGVIPMGIGSNTNETYRQQPFSEPVMNVNEAIIVPGTQYMYVKQSVLSNKGMLAKKYRWAYNGQYPNYWVKNMYTNGPLSDNKSQGLYIGNISSCNNKIIRPCTKNCLPDRKIIGNQGTLTQEQYVSYFARRCYNPFSQTIQSGNGNGSACGMVISPNLNSSPI